MKLCTERALIRIVAERYKHQYHGGRSAWAAVIDGSSTEDTYKKLLQLDAETATAAEVTAIIGNQSWSNYFCCECCNYSPRAIEFDNHGDGAYVCENCVRAAAALLGSPVPQPAESKRADQG